MISFVNKGDGLHDAIRAAGHVLMQVDGVWFADDETAVQVIIDTYPLSATQNEVCAAIEAHAKALRDKVVADVSPAEMASWTMKRAEARAFDAGGNPDDAPTLALEAQARGVALADIVQRVLTNATQLATLEATIAGACGKHKDAVKATATFAAALAYDWTAGWPSV